MRFSNWLAVAILALLASAASATTINRVTNGGFDDPAIGSLAGWHKTSAGRFTSFGSLDGLNGTNGAFYAYSWNSGAISAGNFIAVSQDVDLTGVDNVGFDIRLTAVANNFTNFIVEMFVGTDSLWSANTVGTRLGQSVDVSAYSGVQTLSWRLLATGSVTSGSRRFTLDNVEALAEVTETVPLPPTALMLLSCLAGIGIVRRKRLR